MWQAGEHYHLLLNNTQHYSLRGGGGCTCNSELRSLKLTLHMSVFWGWVCVYTCMDGWGECEEHVQETSGVQRIVSNVMWMRWSPTLPLWGNILRGDKTPSPCLNGSVSIQSNCTPPQLKVLALSEGDMYNLPLGHINRLQYVFDTQPPSSL